MKRRHFLHAAAAAALLPALPGRSEANTAAISPGREFLFFDERFEAARRVAASWNSRCRPLAVHGDITPVWGGGLERILSRQPLHLRGVTTGSFLFCLRILAQDHARVDVKVARLDRDLLAWTMHTRPQPESGARHD